MLASGTNLTAAAEQLQVCRKTVQRKMAKPSFRRLVATLRNQLIATALGRMADNMTRAADVLAEQLQEQDPAVRQRAARALLSLGLRLRDSVELSDRVRDLEREITQKQGAVS